MDEEKLSVFISDINSVKNSTELRPLNQQPYNIHIDARPNNTYTTYDRTTKFNRTKQRIIELWYHENTEIILIWLIFYVLAFPSATIQPKDFDATPSVYFIVSVFIFTSIYIITYLFTKSCYEYIRKISHGDDYVPEPSVSVNFKISVMNCASLWLYQLSVSLIMMIIRNPYYLTIYSFIMGFACYLAVECICLLVFIISREIKTCYDDWNLRKTYTKV